MQANPVGWFEIYVQDMERARKFYEAVLKVNLEKLDSPGPGMNEMWSFPMQENATGASGALAKMDGGPSNGNGTIVYFMCDDCAIEASRAASNGCKVVKDKFSIGKYGFIALLTDTEGNVIGLHSMK
jgi:predicted enzyme related to lactoylglutathione lyase